MPIELIKVGINTARDATTKLFWIIKYTKKKFTTMYIYNRADFPTGAPKFFKNTH